MPLALLATVLAPLPFLAPATDAAPASQGRRAPVAGAPGIGDPYWPLDGNGGIDVLHYDVAIGYSLASGHLDGVTTLTLRPTRDLSRFQLDLLLPATSVSIDGEPAAFSRPDPHELRITPATPLARGTSVEVRVAYGGRPAEYEYAGESNWLADDAEVVAMNQPHMAPWWFPANDHPSDKARFDITVTGDAEAQAVANGLLVDRTVEGDLATTHWRSTSPMATYLAFFALGRYDVRTSTRAGLPFYGAVSRELPPTVRESAWRTLAETPEVTAWLQRRLGPYPFESTGGLVTSLPVGFALENQTRPTYPASLGGDVSLLVHELAHQWFGDSVAVARWRDIWLNEGFATFMEAAYAERHGGPSAQQWLRDTYGRSRDLFGFWEIDLTDPGRDRIFSSAVYNRGGMALQALRRVVGDGDFWRILRTWATQRRDGLGTVPAFRQLAEQVSDRSLDRFFRAWLQAPRPPDRTRANGLK